MYYVYVSVAFRSNLTGQINTKTWDDCIAWDKSEMKNVLCERMAHYIIIEVYGPSLTDILQQRHKANGSLVFRMINEMFSKCTECVI